MIRSLTVCWPYTLQIAPNMVIYVNFKYSTLLHLTQCQLRTSTHGLLVMVTMMMWYYCSCVNQSLMLMFQNKCIYLQTISHISVTLFITIGMMKWLEQFGLSWMSMMVNGQITIVHTWITMAMIYIQWVMTTITTCMC